MFLVRLHKLRRGNGSAVGTSSDNAACFSFVSPTDSKMFAHCGKRSNRAVKGVQEEDGVCRTSQCSKRRNESVEKEEIHREMQIELKSEDEGGLSNMSGDIRKNVSLDQIREGKKSAVGWRSGAETQ